MDSPSSDRLIPVYIPSSLDHIKKFTSCDKNPLFNTVGLQIVGRSYPADSANPEKQYSTILYRNYGRKRSYFIHHTLDHIPEDVIAV